MVAHIDRVKHKVSNDVDYMVSIIMSTYDEPLSAENATDICAANWNGEINEKVR